MGWTRMSRRTADRYHHRPDMEALEARTLLSVSQGTGALPYVPITLTLSSQSARLAAGDSTASGTNFDAITGASAARSQYKVDGSGLSVAVIDAGVNYNHEALGGGFGIGRKVVAGYDFTTNTNDPFATTLDHGTAVAGLIASNDPNHLGIAPGADIVALRVFDNNNQGDFNKVADALQWVIDHHDAYHISTVNLSLSDGRNYTTNWYANDGGVGQKITDLVGQLDALNIPVVTASGNSFNGSQGEGFTSIIPDSISVTATDATDHLVANAQRLGSALGGIYATDMAAPGDGLLAPQSGDSFASVSGTSFAAPMVSGAIVLMQQVYESRYGSLPTVQQLDSWLQNGSDPISDPVTGITIGRLNIPKAIGLIPTPALQILTPPPVVVPPTPPPVVVPPTPPPVVAPTTPPTSTSTSETGGWSIWVNGHPVSAAELNNPNSTVSSVSSWFLRALQSFKNWWSTPSDLGATTKLQFWNARVSNTDQPAPAGVVAKTQVPKVARHTAHMVVSHHPGAIARPWQTFVARKHGR